MPASPYRRRFVAASVAAGSLVITCTRTSRAVAGANALLKDPNTKGFEVPDAVRV
jgi:hypothetical protein